MTPADLKQWRDSLGLSQRAAAEALSVTLPTYQSWECGRSLQTGEPLSDKTMRRAAMHVKDFEGRSKSS